jgi:hypothetical protein
MTIRSISIIEMFDSLSEETLIQIADKDWESLERLCIALTLDIQLLKEEIEYSRKYPTENLAS